MNKLAMYDVDGTIVSSEHRYRTMPCNSRIDLDYWIEMCTPENIAKDTLLPHSEQYIKDLNCIDTMVIIATARTMTQNDANFKYIEQNLGNPDYIIHRHEGDNQSGVTLKIDGLDACIKDLSKFDSITIYEDNQAQLIKMTENLENRGHNVYPVFVESNQGH